MIYKRLTLPLFLLLAFAFSCVHVAEVDAASMGQYNNIFTTAAGDGSFLPEPDGKGGVSGGYYFGFGEEPNLGKSWYRGRLSLTPIGDPANGLSAFENEGRGTDQEVLQEVVYEDGSTISQRFHGEVQLIPTDTPDVFTAQWTGIWEIVRGTGRFLGAKGQVEVTATNLPFNPQTDFFWNFTWTWDGVIKVPKRPFLKTRCFQLTMSTGGFGTFDPANLGLGDPSIFPFPLIIGDGSGEGVYDGTPTGNEFQINGNLIGNGWDRHFGTAQSISPGVPQPTGTVRYPGVTGDNPDGSGRQIHVMKTLVGQIWFNYNHYFELDPTAGAAGTITGHANFQIIGGTFLFRRAQGSVYVRVFSDLANDFDPGDPQNGIPPSADFRYDFTGYLMYCVGRH